MRTALVANAGLVVVLVWASGGTNGDTAAVEADMDAPHTIRLTSVAFAEGQPIPRRHSCPGEDVSPALAWTGVPDDAAALALVLDDPDATRGTFTH